MADLYFVFVGMVLTTWIIAMTYIFNSKEGRIIDLNYNLVISTFLFLSLITPLIMNYK